MRPVKEIILSKRDGQALNPAEIEAVVRGIADGSVSDAQIAALTMATWFRGMSLEEEMALTLAMRDSGRVLAWPDLDGPVLDKHSTGGVGDAVSLVLGPLVAACGGYVPMISGRGLGHSGGTLDKLESIPGFDTSPPIDRFLRLVREQGVAIVGQTAELAPADRRIYAVRDVTATVASVPLIVSSILSKKLAEGLGALVMDIKFGSGAFTPDIAVAEELAREICRVSGAAGLDCTALVTRMDQPLAPVAGNALEVAEVVRFLRGDCRDSRLERVVTALSAELLHMGKLADGPAAAERMAREALDSGRAAECFARMVRAQGGPSDFLERSDDHLAAAPWSGDLLAETDGFLQSIDATALGMAVVGLGGGRSRAEDQVDPSVGLSAICRLGTPLRRGDPLLRVHAADEASGQAALARCRQALVLGPEAPPVTDPVYERIAGDDADG